MSWPSWIASGLAHTALSEGFGVAGTAAKYATNALAPIEAPPLEVLMDLAIRGWIDETALRDGALLRGVTLDTSRGAGTLGGRAGSDLNVVWKQAYYAKQRLPELKETLEIANRFYLEKGWLDKSLQKLGYYWGPTRDLVSNLRFDIPGPSDLVRFSVRHLWEPDLVKELGYNDEFPGGIIDLWHSAKGLDYPLFTGPFADQVKEHAGKPKDFESWPEAYASNGLPEPTWARAYWWSHWILPSPSQGYEALFRLRPDRDPKFDPPEAKGINFTSRDMALLLRANDYPQKYRAMLTAIAYRLPGIRFLKNFVKNKVYNESDVYEWARRWGYGPKDSEDITKDVLAEVQAAEQKQVACKGCQVYEQAYAAGLITADQMREGMRALGADEKEATRLASLAVVKVQVHDAKEVLAALRRKFLHGSLSEQEAHDALRQYGVVPERVDKLVANWSLELESKGKEIAAQKAVHYACKGIISHDDLERRLVNLGYPPGDVAAMIDEAKLCSANLAAQAVQAADKASRKQAEDLYRAQRRARTAMVEAQQALAKHGSPKELRKWFCEGAIGEPEVFTRLRFLGWPDYDIRRLIGDCKAQVGQGPPQSKGGQGGSTGG